MLIAFPGTDQASISEVGGKGYSLIKMASADFPVPPGIILTTAFFAPWFEQLKESSTWTELSNSEPPEWERIYSKLKSLCLDLIPTATQRQTLNKLNAMLKVLGDGGYFAVRSSSPEEDLESTSFAGCYESRINVAATELEKSITYCFSSCFDVRVLMYKMQHGFDVLLPDIAVIIQKQIMSEVSGVGYSINPLTNDHDEAVIEANWGLGESVVAGFSSPDKLVINKITRKIVEQKLGGKQLSIWPSTSGGTIKREGYRSQEYSLSENQLGELTEAICRIENYYEKPVDIEWAYTNGELYVLQARPITVFIPLPPQMLTLPGERRQLYIDAALAKGLTINAPISPLGLDFVERLFFSIIKPFLGTLKHSVDPAKSLLFFIGGRMYINLSNVMLLISLEKLAKRISVNDVMMAKILVNVDAKSYRAKSRPSWAGIKMPGYIVKILAGCPSITWQCLQVIFSPLKSHRICQQKIADYRRQISEGIDYKLPLDEFLQVYTQVMVQHMWKVTLPPLCCAFVAMEIVDLIVGKKVAQASSLTEQLKLGFSDNIVIELGMSLFRLSRMIELRELDDLTGLTERIKNRQMPSEFLKAWDIFLCTFGCRGPLEMDLATPRYADDPSLVLRQLANMKNSGGQFDPVKMNKRQFENRQRAYETLMGRLGGIRKKLLRHLYLIIDLFAGTRDTPKHQGLLINYAMRKRVLLEGKRLVDEDRLDAVEDIFDLTFDDLKSASLDPSLDLRQIRKERTDFINQLKIKVSTFPLVIDSRGRILRPAPSEEIPGELRGIPLSPGVVTGPVKILQNPHEKPINNGDVLVAYTTDPGWTPLFVNAAAVVLEIGGVLQHGAVVAREYGKPCIAGIDGVMTKLHDGQKVEVDGNEGILQFLP